MNRVVKFNEYGKADVLKIVNEKMPDVLLDKEVLVKMSAFALNRANVLFREGNDMYDATFPSRFGSEGVGIVEKVGNGVTKWKEGDRISIFAPENESNSGYFADYNIVDELKLLPVPAVLNDLQASTVWIPFLTVYEKFVKNTSIKKGAWVILPAASSSVSLAANQLAKHLGAKTIGLTRTPAKYEALKNNGYDEVIITQEEDVEKRIQEITDGGADFAFDPVGGSDLVKIINSLKRKSEVCIYGILSGTSTEIPIFPMMMTGVKISCYIVYDVIMNPKHLDEAINYFLPLFEQKKLVPIYDEKIFNLVDVVDAMNYLESNQQIGKVVMKS